MEPFLNEPLKTGACDVRVGAEPMREARREWLVVAAVRPLSGMAAQSRTDRVEENVPRDLQEIGVALDQTREEPGLDRMPDIPVTPVEPLGIARVQTLHPGGEIRFRCLEDKVEVVRHLTADV
jgi:hypothetical protein